jgi:arginine utilization protein RocB
MLVNQEAQKKAVEDEYERLKAELGRLAQELQSTKHDANVARVCATLPQPSNSLAIISGHLGLWMLMTTRKAGPLILLMFPPPLFPRVRLRTNGRS